MDQTLQELWNKTMDYGYEVRKSKKDGLESWQPLKKEYANYFIKGYDEGIPVNESFNKIMKKIKYQIGSDEKEHTDVMVSIGKETVDNLDKNHFFVQHFRIPVLEKNKLPVLEKNKLSVVKVLQIAYNAGQYKAEAEKKNYPTTILEFYDENKLNDIETFIDPKIANMEIMMKEKMGGNYYEKYKKYKTKYLALKR